MQPSRRQERVWIDAEVQQRDEERRERDAFAPRKVATHWKVGDLRTLRRAL